MKKILAILLTLTSVHVFAQGPVTVNQAYKLNRQSKLNRDSSLGTNLWDAQQFGIKAQWSFAVSGGAANSDISLLDMEGLPVTLPTGAVIRDCMLDVVVQPTSSTGSGKPAFSSSAVGDLKAATVVASLTTGRIACIPVASTAATTSIKTASELTLKMRVGSEALTAGKINVWLQFVLSDAS